MTAIFDKDHVIDRRAELDTFSEFVLRTRGGRLLAFHAEKFDGKTMLMERLSYAARKELLGDDGPPTVLVVVDPDEPLPDLIDRLANSLKVEGVAVHGYDSALEAYMQASSSQIHIDASTTVEGRARNVTGATVLVNGIDARPGIELILRKKVPWGLIDDLRVAAQERTVVVMIDQFEKASLQHCVWITELLRTVVFADTSEHGLAVVLASAIDDGRIGPDDLEKIAGPHKGGTRCRVRRGLSLFERQDIVDLMARMSVNATEEDIDMLENWVRVRKTSPGRLKALITLEFGGRSP